MHRRSRPLTEAEAQRLQARSRQHGMVGPVAPPRRPVLRLGAKRPAFSTVQPTPTGYVFTWVGWLPRISGHQVNRFARSRLSRLGRQVFGVLPPGICATRRAHVEIVRVLGPGQKPMDDDSLALLTGGLRDSLSPSYLVNDSECQSTFRCTNDGTRRAYGPCIQITLEYLEE